MKNKYDDFDFINSSLLPQEDFSAVEAKLRDNIDRTEEFFTSKAEKIYKIAIDTAKKYEQLGALSVNNNEKEIYNRKALEVYGAAFELFDDELKDDTVNEASKPELFEKCLSMQSLEMNEYVKYLEKDNDLKWLGTKDYIETIEATIKSYIKDLLTNAKDNPELYGVTLVNCLDECGVRDALQKVNSPYLKQIEEDIDKFYMSANNLTPHLDESTR